MSLLNFIHGPGFLVDIVFDNVAKTASGLSYANNSGKDITIWATVSGTRRQFVVTNGSSGIWAFQVALAFTEPDLTSIGKPGLTGFKITAMDAFGVSI
jgi:hypothetical protein